MHRLFLLAVASTAPAFAQSPEPLVTDRPDFTESATSVEWGRVQLEAGVLGRRVQGRIQGTGPEGLARIGLGRGVEARLSLPQGSVGEGAEGDAGGLGAKVELGSVRGWQAAVLAEVALRWASVSPSAILTIGRDVRAGSVGVQVEAEWDRVQGRLVPAAAAVVGYALSARSGVFGELGLTGGAPLDLTLHGGASRRLSPDVQVDLRAGVGLTTPSSVGSFVGVGGAIRL